MAAAKAVVLVLILMNLCMGGLSSSSSAPDPCLLVANSSEPEKNSTEHHLTSAVCSKGGSILDIDSHLMATNEEAEFLEGRRLLSRQLRDAWGPFAPVAQGVSTECRAQSEEYLRALNNLEFWALQMHDSTAKLGSGLLSGNVNQYGDFHECLSTQPSGTGTGMGTSLKPRYCLAWLQLYLKENEVDPVIRRIHDMVYSHHAFKSNFEDDNEVVNATDYSGGFESAQVMMRHVTSTDQSEASFLMCWAPLYQLTTRNNILLVGCCDGEFWVWHNLIRNEPGHRVPRFSTINWAVCIPSACSARDVMLQLEQAVSNMTAFNIRVRVDSEMCVDTPVKRTWAESIAEFPAETIVCALFLSILLTIAIASFAETWAPLSENSSLARKLLHAFSLRTNLRTLFNTSPSSDDIESVHGVRFFNSFMLVLSHKSMAVFYNGYTNRTQMTEAIGQTWTVIARAASLYTDPFIMMSGLLTAYSLTKQLNRGQKINYRREVTNRLARLLPTLAALILFCTFILPHLGAGPQWNLVVNTHAEICKKYWWRNMLMIHNHFGFENMCLTHTHHLGIDTQLFLVSPLLVWLLWSNPRRGISILTAIATVSTLLRFYFTYTHQLSFFVYFGSSISQMFRTADLSYIMPTHRLTVYIIGIFLGYLLRYCGRDFRIKQSHLRVGWMAALACLYLSVVTPSFMGTVGYEYDALHAANYAAFAPITWCLFFGWIIFTSYIGSGGTIGSYMSWPGWAVMTRLSYGVYLTQFPIFFYNVGTTTAPIQYSIYYMFNLKEVIAIYSSAAILTLVIEMPFQNLRNTLTRRSSPSKAVVSPPDADRQHLKVN